MARIEGISLKKQFGQHFLQEQSIIDAMIDQVHIDNNTSIFEIGCGDGFLTQSILATKAARLFVFEIDPEWAQHVEKKLSDKRLTIINDNFLDINLSCLEEHAPWTVLANLPYQITFPILHTFQENRHLISEGVIMVQEEVAQKIVKSKGKGYGFASLFFQYYFEWKMLNKIPPSAFYPAPKVFSRLLYFKTKQNVPPIDQEDRFWQFIKICFKQPRRTLKNNLFSSHFNIEKIPHSLLSMRAQELSIDQLFNLWHLVL